MTLRNLPVPPNVRFTDTVLEFPPISSGFDRPLWITNPQSGFTEATCEYYSWINRSEPIGIIRLSHSMWKGPEDIELISPVSGLVINNDIFTWGESANRFPGAVLLAESSSIPRTAGEAFEPMLAFAEKHLEKIFLKPRELKGRYSVEDVRRMIAEQRAKPFKLASLQSDYPEICSEIKSRRPDLIGKLP